MIALAKDSCIEKESAEFFLSIMSSNNDSKQIHKEVRTSGNYNLSRGEKEDVRSAICFKKIFGRSQQDLEYAVHDYRGESL
jgi:hypothetical protein